MAVAEPAARGARERRDVRSRAAARTAGPWNRRAILLAVVVFALLTLGLVMSFSASFVDAAEATGDPFGVFRRQLGWAVIGTVLFAVVGSTHYRFWRALSWAGVVLSLIGLVAVLVPGVGVRSGGATRWIALGPIVIQPAEVAKLATLLWLADVLARKRGRDGTHALRHLLIPALPLLALEVVLVLAEPDLGTSVLLAVIVMLVLFAEGLAVRHLFTAAAVGATLVAIATWVAPYRFARITAWLDPHADPLGQGYQLLQSMYALGAGGWFGIGLGASRAKWNFVPNPETDFIYAIVGEEIGLVGAVGVLALFATLLYLGLSVARTAADPFGRTVGIAISGWLAAQALVNIGGVVGLLPITGVPLPLLSVGGSSLLVTLTALGILLSIARVPPARPARVVRR